MMETRKQPCALKFAAAAVAAALSCGVQAADVKFSGYIRQAFSINTEDPIETTENDRGKLSMVRTTLRLDLDADMGGWNIVAKGRASKEQRTTYLRRLEALGAMAHDNNDLVRKFYDEAEIRELYADIPVGDRVRLRLGKQQVAWGETDFFQALDLVHGFDFTWRSFLEPANEELRKPLIMANVVIQVPEANGSLQMLVRPGWDKAESIGNTFDVVGGRWAPQPNKGVDFLANNAFPYDFNHPAADHEDVTGGVRWSGQAFGLSYSLAYLKTFQQEFVLSPATNPYKGKPTTGLFADIIYPKIDVVGVTASGYSQTLDAVFSTEVAYIKDMAFNVGTDNPAPVFGPGAGGLPLPSIVLPGMDGVIEKDVVRWMARMDKNLSSVGYGLGADKPAFFSVQLFDTWIQNYRKSENIINFAGFGQQRKEHSFLLTGILGLSYANGVWVPELVAGVDVTYGGGFIVPSLSWAPSRNWRFKLEYDRFWGGGERRAGFGDAERNTSIFGYFRNNDQLYLHAQYQF